MSHLRRGRVTTAALAMLIGLGISGESAPAAVVYVATTGADANDGHTWDHAKKTVAAGLTVAAAGDQVWVAAGLYVERITLKNGVSLYGGFAGAETDLAQRDIRTNLTILDGNKAGNVVTALAGTPATTRIDGFTIRGGSGETPSGTDDVFGGGIRCDQGSPTIANNIIIDNTSVGTIGYGGGIFCKSASPVICNNAILGNTSDSGGGIFCQTNSAPLIANNTIVANAGAAIVCQTTSAPVITNNILAFNANGVSASSAAPVLSHNCVYNPDGANYTGLDPGTTDISFDPQLLAVDFAETHLVPGSPCIDAGDDTVVQPACLDIDGQPRVRMAHVDIGADEYDGTTTAFAPLSIRVSPTGVDTNDGLTWATAKLTVQAGINTAAAYYGAEVWVAAGTYSQRITLKPWVYVYGGFAGTEEDRDARDWAGHVTILDGGAGGSVVTVTSAHRTSRIDGFTIRNGSGTLVSGTRYGGGIYCQRGSPVITNNTITANTTTGGNGGGIYCYLYSPVISSNTITANTAGSGGAIYCSSCSPPITQNTIDTNTAGSGGGIACSTSSPVISHNTLTRNIASSTSGGAILCTSSSPFIANNTIVGNTASNGSGGGVYCQSSSAPAIANNVFAANSAGNGGGIACSSSAPTIANNVLTGNAATLGGAIHCNSASPPITNNTLTGNTGITNAGGIYCTGASPAISNNIVAFNSSGIYKTGGTPTLANNCVHNPGGFDYSGLDAGTADLSADPLLLAVEYGEVHLTAASPCINAGLDTSVQSAWTDLDGELRTQGDHVDIGADEFNGAAPPFAPPVIRVSPTGNDANDGSTWTSPKLTPQAAIDALFITGGEAWVSAGTYTQRITLKPRIHVFGGFAGTESARDQRNTTLNTTILDGGAGGSVVSAYSGWRTSTLDGFTIRNGTGTLSGSNRLGGGVYCLNSAPFITNNFITANTANTANTGFGGGVYCSNFAPVFARNTISGNSATSGGGLYCANSASALVSNNRIAGNTATNGGAVYCVSSAPALANNIIAGNGANSCAGIYCNASAPLVTNNTIVGNSASDFGAVYCVSTSSPTLSNNIVAFNSSGLHKSSGAPVLNHNCVYNPGGADYSGLSAGTGDLSADPLLVSVDFGEVHLGTGSPCIDAGLDTAVQPGDVDLDGQPRIQAAHVDIGADEYDGATPEFLPRVVRVSPTGDDANDGSTWPTAKKTVQAGIDAAWTTGGEVWAAAGTYNERIVLRPWAYVYGGFAGSETQLDQRHWTVNPTILDGGAGGSVVTAQSGGRDSGLDGFTIRNGSGTLSGNNRLGGGVYCVFSSPRIANNTITANAATSGGGLYIASCAPVISANTISTNTATAGGGIFSSSASAVISDNTITANTASSGNGGGIYCSSMSPLIINNRILRNTATSSYGGAIYCASTATISADLITGNVAVNGGAIYCASSSPKIFNSVIAGNRATAFGGAMYNLTSSPAITNCTFATNAASNTTGLYNNSSSNPALANCILWGHTGTPITNLSNSLPTYSHCDVQIAVNGTGNVNGDPKFARNPSPGPDNTWGTADDDYGNLRLKSGSPCIDAGMNSAVPAGTLTDLDGQSRFINDLLTADCTFAPNTCGGAPLVDMGPYEWSLPGDFDHDGDVDRDDRNTLTACLSGPGLPCLPECLPADFDHDNDVDQTDFAIWQRCFRGPTQPLDPTCGP